MLTPEQLDKFPDSLVELYSQAEIDIISDIARRISTYDYFIPSAEFQYRKLKEMGHVQILKRLSKLTGKTKKELETMMFDAGYESIKFDDKIYKKAGLSPKPIEQSPALMSVLDAGIKNTSGLFENLTRTTASTATKQFENVLDNAYMQITTGAFDSNTAIRNAIKDLAGNGLASVQYPNGHINYIESAVRRAVITGVNQTALKMQEARAVEMGSDLVETSAHAGARPSHAIWQGKVFSLSGTHPKYPDFKKETGYGTGAGLGGWHCRHNFYPFFEGLSEPAYSKQELQQMNAKDYEYNGEKMTEYEATQKQRAIERKIRRWKREYKGMEAAGLHTDEAAAKISQWQNIQKDFLQQTGLKRQTDREQIPGFGKSEAKKVEAVAKLPGEVIRFNKSHVALTEEQKLPDYINAIIPEAKISGYALNKEHPTGKNKAIVFDSVLGYNIGNKDLLLKQVNEGLKKYQAKARPETKYGQPYEVSMMIKGVNGRYAKVKTGWIIDNGSKTPRLTSIRVAKKEGDSGES